MYRKFTLHLLLLFLLGHTAQAQGRWIANAAFINNPAVTLYDLGKEYKPVILAVGNVHTLASEQLFEQHLLQKLVRDHSMTGQNSTRDIRVAFLNVQVFPDEPLLDVYKEVPVLNIDESGDVLNLPGWNELYSISATGLYLVAPDHLVYKLDATTADDVYNAVKTICNKLRPIAGPDVRLLDVRADANLVHVSVQNFSNDPASDVLVSISRDGKVIASAAFKGTIAPLNAVMIDMTVKDDVLSGSVEVIALEKGDMNPLNNVWTGYLVPANGQPAVAGNVSK